MIRVVMTLINLIIAALFFTVIYSAANIDVSFNVDTRGVWGYNLDGDTLRVEVPVEIRNEGLYPVEDIRIHVSLEKGSQEIYNKTATIGKVDALQRCTKILEFNLNLSEMYQKLGEYYLTHEGIFKFKLVVSARYWVLADFNAVYERNITWKPLLHTYRIYTDEIKFANGYIEVPYFVSKLPIDVDADITVRIRDNLGLIGFATGKLVFDRKSTIKVAVLRNMDYLLTRRTRMTIEMSITVGSVTVTKEYKYVWTPPLKNMGITENIVNGTPVVYLVFQNNLGKELNIAAEKLVTVNGTITERWSGYLTLRPGQYGKIPLYTLRRGVYDIVVKITVEEYGISKTLTYHLEV
jgi:hypothetical protein